MEHRKHEHENITPKCKNTQNGPCFYGVNCWFRHTEKIYDEENEKNKNGINGLDNVMQRMFRLMEEMTERMSKIENDRIKN